MPPFLESPWPALVAAAAAITALVLFVRRRSHRPLRVAPLTETVAQNADRARRAEYRTELAERLTRCGQRVARADTGRVTEALAAYTAAATVLDRAQDKSDLVGVHVLLDLCEAHLAGEAPPERCFFDPRHEGKVSVVRWRSPASFDSVRVRACQNCRKAVRSHRAPESVPDSTGPRTLPYYAVSAEESVWAATGYGAFADDLPERIARGEHRPEERGRGPLRRGR